ncbi:hypothetical protein TWF694_003429 [Orbilia ellipsospora]|uniref:Uncharacterized protein n=1 Tax=Orbilia ellipsospora TaxID=2528407 RepID=A0AAV9WY82_9PEZI
MADQNPNPTSATHKDAAGEQASINLQTSNPNAAGVSLDDMQVENPGEDVFGDDDDDDNDDDDDEEGSVEYETDSGDSDGGSEESTDTYGRGRPRKVRESSRPAGYYPHPLDGENVWGRVLPYREQYHRLFSAAIRNKPGWTEKITNRELFAKWLREAQKQSMIVQRDEKVLTWNPDDIGYAYAELTECYKPYVEKLRKEGFSVEPDIDGVWRSDQLIDEELKKQLIEAVATLENVPESEKDWHPGSKRQVLDLVHPSLWPIVYDRSVSITNGEPIQKPKEMKRDKEGFSQKFCWLPSEFEISSDGKETKISSYINNLASPQQKELFYPILEKIFTKFVPLFNHVLGDLRTEKHDLKRVYASAGNRYWYDDVASLEVSEHEKMWNQLLDQYVKDEPLDVNFYERLDRMLEIKGDDRTDVYERRKPYQYDSDSNFYQLRSDMGILSGSRWAPPEITDEVNLNGKTVKVITKLANIELTPDSPKYNGGSWHVEAMLNERIISTGIYYYAQENITDSELAFRRTVSDVPHVMDLEQYSNWPYVFNMASWDASTVQTIGSIQTKENRAIAFPNIFQHQVQPFKLIDKTKPGYRKILVFFLCDPSPDLDLPTTKTVAPQQPEFREEAEQALRSGNLGKMPEEVFNMILEKLPEAITKLEALEYREQLMKERSVYNKSTTMVQGVSYSLCEH